MRIVKAIKSFVKLVQEIFDDWLTRSAAVICLLIIVIVISNMSSSLADHIPLLGTLVYGMVPILFILGGVIFVMAILKFSGRGEKNGPS